MVGLMIASLIGRRRFYSTLMTIKNLHLLNPIDDSVRVRGWIKGIRKQKDLTFIDVDDASGKKALQVILNEKMDTSTMTFGAAVEVDGRIVASSHPKQKIELVADRIEMFGCCDIKSFPFRDKRQNYSFDVMRQYLHLRPRLDKFKALLKIRNETVMSVHKYYQGKEYYLINTPIVTSNDCEGGGEIFQVQPAKTWNENEKKPSGNEKLKDSKMKDEEYFDRKAFLTVSGQLHLESMICSGFPRVYTLGPAFRAENTRTSRHLSEFYMLEAEIAFIKHLSDLMKAIEEMIKEITKDVLTKCEDEFHLLEKLKGRRDDYLSKLENFISSPFKQCTYTNAVDILKRNPNSFSTEVQWGMSLQREHEEFLVNHFGQQPLFVTDFPASISPFYMKTNGDRAKTVAAVDLLFPGVGELCGGSLREDKLQTMEANLQETKTAEKLSWYLDLRRYGNVPHGGYGMGFERYLQFLCGISNIRDTIPFPRWPHHCKM